MVMRDTTYGVAEDHKVKSKAEALALLATLKGNVRFRLHAAAITPGHPRDIYFRACVPLTRPAAVQFIMDAWHPHHEQDGHVMHIRVAEGARPARMQGGELVEYGKPRRFVYIG